MFHLPDADRCPIGNTWPRHCCSLWRSASMAACNTELGSTSGTSTTWGPEMSGSLGHLQLVQHGSNMVQQRRPVTPQRRWDATDGILASSPRWGKRWQHVTKLVGGVRWGSSQIHAISKRFLKSTCSVCAFSSTAALILSRSKRRSQSEEILLEAGTSRSLSTSTPGNS